MAQSATRQMLRQIAGICISLSKLFIVLSLLALPLTFKAETLSADSQGFGWGIHTAATVGLFIAVNRINEFRNKTREDRALNTEPESEVAREYGDTQPLGALGGSRGSTQTGMVGCKPATATLWDIEVEKSTSYAPRVTGSYTGNVVSPFESPKSLVRSQAASIPVLATRGTPGDISRRELPARVREVILPNTMICAECGKSYSRRYRLNRHRRLQHLRSHKCTVQGCEYQQIGFGKPNDLARHMTNVHRNLAGPQTLHLCPVGGCEYHTTGFGRKDNWKRHVMQQHGISVD